MFVTTACSLRLTSVAVLLSELQASFINTNKVSLLVMFKYHTDYTNPLLQIKDRIALWCLLRMTSRTIGSRILID